jgi:hypothetical protein
LGAANFVVSLESDGVLSLLQLSIAPYASLPFCAKESDDEEEWLLGFKGDRRDTGGGGTFSGDAVDGEAKRGGESSIGGFSNWNSGGDCIELLSNAVLKLIGFEDEVSSGGRAFKAVVGLEGKGIAESEDTDTGDVGFERVEKDED